MNEINISSIDQERRSLFIISMILYTETDIDPINFICVVEYLLYCEANIVIYLRYTLHDLKHIEINNVAADATFSINVCNRMRRFQ